MNNRTRIRKRKLFIKKKVHQSIVVSMIVIIILLLSTTSINTVGANGVVMENVSKEVVTKEVISKQVVIAKVDTEEVSRGSEDIRNIPNYDITLSKDLQEFTFGRVQLCGYVEYSTVLALLYSESRFDANATNHNDDGSTDEGIAQINDYNTAHYAQTADLVGTFDPYIAEHGIQACVYKLQMLADVWVAQGITDKDTLELYVINSYHRSVNGFKGDMATYGTPNSSYSDLVLSRKNQLLTQGYFSDDENVDKK